MTAGCSGYIPYSSNGSDLVAFTVESSAMEPRLHCARPAAGCEGETADFVQVRRGDPVDRGDIVVFRTPGRARVLCGVGGRLIMRVVGFPGDRWSVRRGVVHIDGRPLDERYVHRDKRTAETVPPRVIPARRFLVLGDARNHACDSRRWGYVPAENIIGPVVHVERG